MYIFGGMNSEEYAHGMVDILLTDEEKSKEIIKAQKDGEKSQENIQREILSKSSQGEEFDIAAFNHGMSDSFLEKKMIKENSRRSKDREFVSFLPLPNAFSMKYLKGRKKSSIFLSKKFSSRLLEKLAK
jgi:hypothetical protein